MQEVIECEKCKKKLLSMWPYPQDPGRFMQLTGFHDPEMDHTRVPNFPYPIETNAIFIDIRETYVRIDVFCPDCNHGGGASLRIQRPKPQNPTGLRAKIRQFYSTWFGP